VILPGLAEMPVLESPDYEFPATALDGFLERAADETSYQLAGEVRRGYALMIAALFERQLSGWLFARLEGTNVPRLFSDKLEMAASGHVDLLNEELGARLRLLHLVGNVVRHGDGSSLAMLRETAPQIWSGKRAIVTWQQTAETIILSDSRLRDFMLAVTRFWGLADNRPGAIVEAPY
jgi:hypothetical protein